jgi:CHASE2 domain-containing sensor protein
MPKMPNLEKWFDRLVRNKMQGAAVATAGVAIGLAIMTAGLFPWGHPFQSIVTVIGLTHVAVSSLLFLAFAALQFYKSL